MDELYIECLTIDENDIRPKIDRINEKLKLIGCKAYPNKEGYEIKYDNMPDDFFYFLCLKNICKAHDLEYIIENNKLFAKEVKNGLS